MGVNSAVKSRRLCSCSPLRLALASPSRALGGCLKFLSAGLGLWVSASLVERYGGRIVAANRDDGPGARFVVVLPAVEAR